MLPTRKSVLDLDPAGSWTTRRPPYDRKETQTVVVWSCLPFFSSNQAKTILQGTEKRGRRRDRQRKRWEDNIREWTGLEFSRSQRAGENREKWRKLVAKSSVVPQRPSRLTDWWWWWWCVSIQEKNSNKDYTPDFLFLFSCRITV